MAYTDPGTDIAAAKLNKLARESNHVICEISSVFPFQLFPDRIIIDENKITIVRKDFFFKRVIPIMYKDILSVKITRGLIFASMEFEVRRFEQNPRPINYLWPKEATTAKKCILGIIEARIARVDFSKLKTEHIREKVKEIGTAQEEAESLF